MQQKLLWVDNLKVLGIFSVILGHIASPFTVLIFSFHMPLFFILSGFFIKFDLTLKDFVLKDFKRLMIPYFIFAILGLLAEILKRCILHRDSLNILDELHGLFIWMDMNSLMNTYSFVLWFLPALFFSRFFLFIINKYSVNVFVQFIVVAVLFKISFFINLPFAIDNGFNALLFVFIGHTYFKFYQKNKILYLFPFILIGIYLLFGIPSLDIASKNYSNIFINILFSTSIIYSFILVLKNINLDNKLLKIWGRNTMLLFIVHPYTNNIAHIIVQKLHFGDWYLKFLISLILLQCILLIKQKFKNRWIFKYV